jgi:DNA-binding NarL/FixJ family response regulator
LANACVSEAGVALLKRLLIIADESFAKDAMRLVLYEAGMEVVGVLSGRKPLRWDLLELLPDVVILNDMESTEATLERLREAAEVMPETKRILLTTRMDADWLEEAIDAGADAAISKMLHPIALGTLLRETVRGNIVQRFRRTRLSHGGCQLTPREAEILSRVAQGHTNGRIARELWVTEQTVKFHLRNTYRKLGVANRTEATRYAYLNALVNPEEELAC